MPRAKVHHEPDCRLPHDTDLDCDEAALIQAEESLHAKWDCTRSPSRTQPFHDFDPQDGECVYGCGTSRDQLRDGPDADW